MCSDYQADDIPARFATSRNYRETFFVYFSWQLLYILSRTYLKISDKTHLYIGVTSFLYQTTRIAESLCCGGLRSQGSTAVPPRTALTCSGGPETGNVGLNKHVYTWLAQCFEIGYQKDARFCLALHSSHERATVANPESFQRQKERNSERVILFKKYFPEIL